MSKDLIYQKGIVMIIVLKENPNPAELNSLRDWLRSLNLEVHYSQGSSTTLMGLIGDTSQIDLDMMKSLPVVDKALRIQDPFKKASIKFKPEPSVVKVDGVSFGDGSLPIIAGPCSIENESILMDVASSVKSNGAHMLRGGAFKPRTSPYSFQGMREKGLELLIAAKKKVGMPIVSEITEVSQIDLFEEVDLIQVGARNMQNFELLKELSKSKKPVLLKRSPAATIEELLMSAEYILNGGNENIILCERGIKTFETSTKNTLDISAIPVIKSKSHLPVIVDPSHGTGKNNLVIPMAMAAVAAGADGLMIEVHSAPHTALCDGPQALVPDEFAALSKKISNLKEHL